AAAPRHGARRRASRSAAAAVDGGLVRRGPARAAARRSLLVRPPAGRALSQDVHATRRQAFARATADWSNAERAVFARLLWRFLRGLEGQQPERRTPPERPTR